MSMTFTNLIDQPGIVESIQKRQAYRNRNLTSEVAELKRKLTGGKSAQKIIEEEEEEESEHLTQSDEDYEQLVMN